MRRLSRPARRLIVAVLFLAGVDAIDWIERIPIEETRHYVEKVLANVQVYRARLGEPRPLRLEQDLAQATGLKRAAAR